MRLTYEEMHQYIIDNEKTGSNGILHSTLAELAFLVEECSGNIFTNDLKDVLRSETFELELDAWIKASEPGEDVLNEALSDVPRFDFYQEKFYLIEEE